MNFSQYVLLPFYVHCARHVIQLRSSKIRIENASEFNFFVKALDHGRGRQTGKGHAHMFFCFFVLNL